MDKISALFEEIARNFSSASNGPDFIKNNMAKLIFYSSAIEGNRLDDSTGLMLINRSLEIGSGRLVDYIELLSHKEVYERVAKIGDNAVSSDDIIEMHEALFVNLFNNLYAGPRRSMASVGNFITEDATKISDVINGLAEMLNLKAATSAEAFSNAVNFHLKFVEAHPFEDGNGRIVRVMMNWYLLRNGIAPVLITIDKKKDYFSSLEPYNFCRYDGAFAAFMLYTMIKNSGMDPEELAQGIGDGMEERLIKDYLMVFDGKMDQKTLLNEIMVLYSSGDKECILGALWLAGCSKARPRLLSDAIINKDPEIASMTMLSMEKRANASADESIADLEEHAGTLKAIALNGTDNRERLLAISLLGKLWVLDGDTVGDLLKDQKDLRVTAQIFNTLRYNSKNQGMVGLMDSYAGESSIDVGTNAYIALLVNAPTEYSEKRLRNIGNERDEVKDEVIKWLGRIEKEEHGNKKKMINLDVIANTLIATAKSDSRVRKLLLGHLSLDAEGLNRSYIGMLKDVVNDKGSDETEKAYAAYCMGKSMGYDYLHSETGLRVDDANSNIINMAVFLSLTAGKEHANEIIEALDVKNDSLNAVEAVSISRMLDENAFGADFLFLCRESFHAWRPMPPSA